MLLINYNAEKSYHNNFKKGHKPLLLFYIPYTNLAVQTVSLVTLPLQLDQGCQRICTHADTHI